MTTPVLQQQLEERIDRELPHLTAEDRCVLARIIERLVEVNQPDRIYLFGSKARGDAGPDSDYDILVLVEHPTEPLYRLSQRGFRALRGIAAAVDVVVWDRVTFDARLHLPASFPATVVREGRLLYVA
jgi:predicted nucleotidyltransferase